MEPVSRVLSDESTKSYLERELIISLDEGGPMIGPSLETMDSNYTSPNQQSKTIVRKGSTSATSTVNSEKEHTGTSRRAWRWKCGPSSDTDPSEFSNIKKNMILFIVAIAGSIPPISSTIYYPALVTMQNAFHTSDTVMNASLSVFTFFTAFFPLIWATFSDAYGRRSIYIISYFISLIGSICCALSVNAEMFIVFRAFSAIGSSSAMSMGAGTIADIFEPHERGRAFAYYTCGPLLGPALGPIIGGYLNEGLGWRSNFWFLSIFCLFTWLGIVFFLPETWRKSPDPLPVATTENKDKDQTTKLVGIETQKRSKRKIINPIGALKLLQYPNIALTVTFAGVLFFVLYLNSTCFTRTYTLQYGFSSGLVGVCYLPFAAGSMTGGIMGGRMSDKTYTKNTKKTKETKQDIYPEMRLGGSILWGSIVLQLFGFVAYGWCIEKNVHFAYGLLCQFFIGLALMFPNVTLNAYMVDCFRTQGASVTACNNFARYIMAGIGSLIASDFQRALGSGPLFTFCGGFLLLASVNLFIIKKMTLKWAVMRENSTD
ncbi:MAG: major facilitator superfamily domain-containing protein [Benjaminiella poitrasii]|nr:MAG: major facilitator superfamily domain-containing protein [Benjaminiella poitrasii]